MIHMFCLFSIMNFFVCWAVYIIYCIAFKNGDLDADFKLPGYIFLYIIASLITASFFNHIYMNDFDHKRNINNGEVNIEEYLPIVSSKSKSDLIGGSKYTVKLSVYSFYNSSEINVSKEEYDLLQIGSIYMNNVSSSTNYVVPMNGVTPQKK